ncbi:MAG: metal ABC transporter permease [Verrucomicrobia bacterium]|nr:metal ABC transporter permease [Verrucomicrobiota bacterium]MCH8510518.1 metal ABC transporter permease [Kiritimatiellia bacterium]
MLAEFIDLFDSHNTRVVLTGVTLLGVCSGVIGVFLLLRRRSLMADATSHATLPGIALAFLVQPAFGFAPRFLPGLLLGALIAGLLGMWTIQAIQKVGRIREDAAMGIVLSVFYGFGICLLGIIQTLEQGGASGLKGFIFGKTASMLASDAQLISVSALLVILMVFVFYKEWILLCFDDDFAGSQGWPVTFLDGLLMGAVVVVTVIGLQAVGLILMIALLVVPPAAARFWTDRMSRLLLLSGLFGGGGAFVGAMISASEADLPAGAVIVLSQGVFFVISMFFGRRRGLLGKVVRHQALGWTVRKQHVLRTFYEAFEDKGVTPNLERARLSFETLLKARSWTRFRLGIMLWHMKWSGWVYRHPDGTWGLTRDGWPRAARLVRNHRLWELFLIHYAEIAPAQVDRGADRIEHVLDPAVVDELERLLKETDRGVPMSPHPIPWGEGI